MKNEYQQQMQHVVYILPLIQHEDFALKGGTAINLFFRDLPRLSIDIDLTYLPIEERDVSFKKIHTYLSDVMKMLKSKGYECKSDKPLDGKAETKLVAWKNEIQIKIEPNFTIRGAVNKPTKRIVTNAVVALFGNKIEANCLSFEDVFAGKICAALTRQHPRDLFDIRLLLDNEGISDNLKNVFIYYLISAPKPFFEVLMPRTHSIENLYRDKFSGMSQNEVSTAELEQSLHELIATLRDKFTEQDVMFLKSLLELKPRWDLTTIGYLQDYPSVKWRLLNLKKMNSFKRTMEMKKLDEYLAKQ